MFDKINPFLHVIIVANLKMDFKWQSEWVPFLELFVKSLHQRERRECSD